MMSTCLHKFQSMGYDYQVVSLTAVIALSTDSGFFKADLYSTKRARVA